ncbi:ABC transporter substrate-binding protein [Pelistega europaea]|uniref:ABC transporter substrate-binding protein n=1 Tax=Pelistega europaea TaxID=106147 RepID=A0A7Y4P453_9BURK|nr:ABC transporter substrate-binding protein [Pelistega europaea]NOL49737.1 ABC transporter substrate-binding protein [Pelistega europaea]
MKKTLLSVLTAALLASAGAVQAEPLKIAFADNLSSLDPQLNNYAGDRSAGLFFFDMLVSNYHQKLLPSLATEWKNIDENTWEFTLRPNVKWSNGDLLTVDDVIYSIERIRHVPGSVAPFTSYVRTVASVTAKDANTLVFKTSVPNPDLPLNLASVPIVHKATTEKATSEDFNSGKALIGTGPYVLESYTPGKGFVAKANPNYWGDKVLWDSVDYRYTANAAARTAALLAGDVDVIDKVSVSDLPSLEKNPKVSVYAYNGLRVLILQPSFNPSPNKYITDNSGKPLDKNPLLDVRVRKALSIAINRDAIASRILQNGVTVANQWMPEGSIGYNPAIKNIAFDAATAKKLLAEAGYPEGFKLTVHVPSDRYPLAPETVQAVAQFWTRIGVKTEVQVVPWAVYAGSAKKNEYAMSVIAWGNGTGEASYAMVSILATVNPEKGLGASNWGHFSNAQFDSLLAQTTKEFDQAKREGYMREAAQVVSDEVGIIPLFHYKNIWAAKKGLVVKPLSSDRTVPVMVTKE